MSVRGNHFDIHVQNRPVQKFDLNFPQAKIYRLCLGFNIGIHALFRASALLQRHQINKVCLARQNESRRSLELPGFGSRPCRQLRQTLPWWARNTWGLAFLTSSARACSLIELMAEPANSTKPVFRKRELRRGVWTKQLLDLRGEARA